MLAITYMLYEKKYFLDFSNYAHEFDALKGPTKELKDIFPFIGCTKTLNLTILHKKLNESWGMVSVFFFKKGFTFK